MGRGKGQRPQRGFTYLGVLFLVVLLGLALAGTGEAWSVASRRARERELLWVGTQYAKAIRAYYLQSPGVRQFPSRFEDLLEDRRFPEPRHHLRKIYQDPISREPFEIVLSTDGRIGGVHSKSDDTPMKQDNFSALWRDFKGSTHYSDWLFIADGLPGSPARGGAAAAAAGALAGGAAAAANDATGSTPGSTPAANVTIGTVVTGGAPGTTGQDAGQSVLRVTPAIRRR